MGILVYAMLLGRKTQYHKDVKQTKISLHNKCNFNINPNRIFSWILIKVLLQSMLEKAEKRFTK